MITILTEKLQKENFFKNACKQAGIGITVLTIFNSLIPNLYLMQNKQAFTS